MVRKIGNKNLELFYTDESYNISPEAFSAVMPKLSRSGPISEPFIISTSEDFRKFFGDLYIKKKSKRIFNELDPYGEEDWEE